MNIGGGRERERGGGLTDFLKWIRDYGLQTKFPSLLIRCIMTIDGK